MKNAKETDKKQNIFFAFYIVLDTLPYGFV